MTSFTVPTLAPILEATPALLPLIISRLAPIAAAVLAAEVVVPVLVVSATYAASQAYYSWSKANNEAIQSKAKIKYCALNSSDPECANQATFTGGQMAEVYDVLVHF